LSSGSSRTVSSDEVVIEDDKESAGVDVGVLPWLRARASASETAERYEVAEVMGGRELLDFFLNIEGVGD
jgi:hypothetical protein